MRFQQSLEPSKIICQTGVYSGAAKIAEWWTSNIKLELTYDIMYMRKLPTIHNGNDDDSRCMMYVR